MKSYKKILAFGDSHVAGCELSSATIFEDYLAGKITLEDADNYGKQLAFPNILGKLTDTLCENYALSGGSNQRSVRKLLEAIDYNCLILFGYTDCDRAEFYYPDDGMFLGRDNDLFVQTGIQWTGPIENLYDKSRMYHPFNQVYLKYIHRPYNSIEHFFKQVSCIAYAYSCDIIHLPMSTFIDQRMFDFEGQGNYLKWCESNGFTQMPLLHYGEDAHQRLAELLWKNIGDIT